MSLKPRGSGVEGRLQDEEGPRRPRAEHIHQGRPPTAERPPEWGSAGARRHTPPGDSTVPAEQGAGRPRRTRSSTPGTGGLQPGLAPLLLGLPQHQAEGEGGEGAGCGPGTPPGADEPSAGRDGQRVIRCGICCETEPPATTTHWSKEPEWHTRRHQGLPRRTRGSRGAGGPGNKAPGSRHHCQGCGGEPCGGRHPADHTTDASGRPSAPALVRGGSAGTASPPSWALSSHGCWDAEDDCSLRTVSEGKGKTSSHGFHEAHTSPGPNLSQGPGGQSGETGGRSVSREQATGLSRPSPPAHRQDDAAESQQGLVLHTPHHRDAEIPAHRERATMTSLPLTLISSKTV